MSRWLDDQNIGVRSVTEARKVINRLTRSLSSQRLTVNAGKTKFLMPSDVVSHFQLDANQAIDEWEQTFKVTVPANVAQARQEVENVWARISVGSHVAVGNWAKVLKRMYAAFAKIDSGLFEQYALNDLIEHPELDERIFQYYAKRNRADQLLGLFLQYCSAGENLFEGTESVFFESTLLLDPDPRLAARIRRLASGFASGNAAGQSGKPLGRSSAILVMYWFGESSRSLESLFDADTARRLPKEVARTWIATVAAIRPGALKEVQAKLVGHQSYDVARRSAFLTGLRTGTVKKIGKYKSQKSRWLLPGKCNDARSWLLLDIASSTPDRGLRSQLGRDLKSFQALVRTFAEKRVASRIARRLN